MYLFRIFYSFLPLRNPIGFGASDLVILAIAVLMVVIILARAWLSPYLPRIANRTIPCMLLLFAMAIALRVTLLLHSPAPIPSGADDFGYLLLGDTLAHFRFSNPTHPLYQFFESVFILQQPTYSSIYPLAQGFILALGQWLTGSPWVGVLLSSGLFCAFCYWMLRAWVSPVWALAGGMLAIMEFGPLSPWVNSYWGGYSSAIAGCLVFGSLPRLHQSPRLRDGILLGLGLALQVMSRPFESMFLFCAVAGYLAFSLRSKRNLLIKPLCRTVGMLSIALGLMIAQNKAVTQNWTTVPYMLSRYQYGVPTTFVFQPNPTPHRQMTAEQELDYQAQSAIHGPGTDSISGFIKRLFERFRYLRFFLLPPLYFSLLAFLPSLRQRRYLWAVGTVILFALGTNLYPYFFPHYIAALTCLFVLFSVEGLKRLDGKVQSLVLTLCCASFGFWFVLYCSGQEDLLPLNAYQTWNYLNISDPQGRFGVEAQLAHYTGPQLVFVRYTQGHRFEEWVHNSADIDSSRTVWANDLGDAANEKLLSYYPSRKAWLLQPDVHPPALTPYTR